MFGACREGLSGVKSWYKNMEPVLEQCVEISSKRHRNPPLKGMYPI